MNMKIRICSLAGLAILAFTLAPDALAQGWEFTNSLPSPRHRAIGVNANGTLLVLGGTPVKGNKSLVDALPPGGSWSEVAQLPDNTEGLGAGYDSLGRIIVFGGILPLGVTPTPNGYVYTTASGRGAAIAPKHFAVYDFGLAADSQRRIYAIGGQLGSGFPRALSAGVERYEAESDSWSVLAPMPSPRTQVTAAYDGLGHILVFGGIDANSTLTTTVFSYDIAGDAWTQLADVPVAFTGPVNNGAAVLGADGLVYLVGPGVSVFDPQLKVWFSGPRQHVVRGAPAATLGNNGYLYVMGGDMNPVDGAFLDTVECLDTASPTPPAIKSTPATTVRMGASFAYQIIASGNPRPSYSLASGPLTMSVNASNGIVSWTPSAGELGVYPVTVRVSNSVGAADQSFTLSVVVDQPIMTGALLPQAGGFRLSAVGTPGVTYGVEATTDFAVWTRIGSGKADGSGRFEFTNAPGESVVRFYRTVFP
jgi:putative Ig domain-containing protein/galactose oxidase-like protein/Kelch motif protein